MTTGDFERAVALHAEGKIAEAERLCRAILLQENEHPRALHLLGVIRFSAKEYKEGIALLERAVAANPDYAEAIFNLAAMLNDGGRREEALKHYGRVAELRPANIDAHRRYGALLMDFARYVEAEAAFRRVADLEPDDIAAAINLSTLALAQGRADDAATHARRAVALAPDDMDIRLRLARALAESGALDEAEAACRVVLERDSTEASAFFNLGRIQQGRGETAGAVENFRTAVRLSPGSVDYRRTLHAALLYADDDSSIRNAADPEWSEFPGAAVAAVLPFQNVSDPSRRLRIGFLSSDFRSHPVGRNLQMLATHRDRGRFEWFLYAHSRKSDTMTDWFRKEADQWRPVSDLSDEQVAALIREDGIDVMVYLAGRFDYNRPQVAAWRPAPVQISFHDPATSGLAAMDYLIADPVLAPRRSEERFTERLLRLPSYYTHAPIGFAADAGALPAAKNGFITFASFNNPAKVSNDVLRLWAAVLAAVPTSRLMLKYKQAYGQPSVQKRVRSVMEEAGIAADRVALHSADDYAVDHIALYRNVDIALDTFPFTGSTTTFEALWMGVPVITLKGSTMVGRWSASILHTLKLDELVAGTRDDFIAIAARLAGDTDRLARLRAELRPRVAASPLCNGRLRGRQIERLLRAAWGRWCKGRQPKPEAPAFSMAADTDYFAKLQKLVSAGSVTIQSDPAILNSMNSPIYVEADVTSWAMGAIALFGGLWWGIGIWAGAAGAALCLAGYATIGRRMMRQKIAGRIRNKVLTDIELWRRLWRYGGVSLVDTRSGRTAAAPADSWIRLVEEALTAKAGTPPAG